MPKRTFRLRDGVKIRAEDFGGLVYAHDLGTHHLNATGFQILSLCDGEKTAADIAREMNAEEHLPEITAFLETAKSQTFIEEVAK